MRRITLRSITPVAVGLAVAIAASGTMAARPDPGASQVPAAGFEFVRTGSLHDGRIGHSATLLADGRVLVIGGYETASAELWDPDTGEWSPAGSMAAPREGHHATLLPDGRVVVVGGHRDAEGDAQAEESPPLDPPVEVWDPVTRTFDAAGSDLVVTSVDSSPEHGAGTQPRDGAVATTLLDGRVLVTGGWEKTDPACHLICSSAPVNAADLVDPESGVSSATAHMNYGRAEHTATLLPDGRVLIVGSHDHGPVDKTAELFQLLP